MIRLYTSKARVKDKFPGFTLIDSIDAYFDLHFAVSSLTRGDLRLMEQLESVRLVRPGVEIFEAPEGYIRLEDISTGLKTLLLVRWLKRRNVKNVVVDVTECGPNILDYVFEELTDGCIPIILRHTDIRGIRNRVVSVDDAPVVRTMRAVVMGILDSVSKVSI